VGWVVANIVGGVRFLRKFALFKPDSLASPAFEPVTLLLLNYGRTHVLLPNFGDAVRSVGTGCLLSWRPFFPSPDAKAPGGLAQTWRSSRASSSSSSSSSSSFVPRPRIRHHAKRSRTRDEDELSCQVHGPDGRPSFGRPRYPATRLIAKRLGARLSSLIFAP
jgi:hypothetical protein